MIKSSPSIRSCGFFVTFLFSLTVVLPAHGDEFRSDWSNQVDRRWVGPGYWTNPLQDWRLRDGRLECVNNGKNRNVQLLTRRVGEKDGTFSARVTVGLARDGGHGFAGFQIGIRSGGLKEYRYDLVHGKGLNAGITSGGELFIGSCDEKEKHDFETVELRLRARPDGESYTLLLSAHDPENGDRLQQITRENVAAKKLTGNIGLVTRYHDELGWNKPRFWFRDLTISGPKITVHKDRTFGPILWSMYTLDENVLNLRARMLCWEKTAED